MFKGFLVTLFGFLAFSLGANPAAAQQAAQWNYDFQSNVATAHYPGNVQIPGLGTASCIASTGGLLSAGTCLAGGFANPTASVGLTAVDGSATTSMRSDAAPALSQSISPTMTGNWIFAPTSGNGPVINPPAASTSTGLTVGQSGPSSGSTGTGLAFNLIHVAGDQSSTTGTNQALSVIYGFGGANMQGQRAAIIGTSVLNTAGNPSNPTKVYVGVSGEGTMNAADGGTDTGSGAAGGMLGTYASSIAGSASSDLFEIVGQEINTSIRTGSSSRFHIGQRIVKWADSAVVGAELDGAMQIGVQSGALGWANYGIVFDSSSAGTGNAFGSGATIIGTKGATTVANGIDFSSATISGSVLKGPNVSINGAGALGLGSAGTQNGRIFLSGATSGQQQIVPDNVSGGIFTLPGSLSTAVVNAEQLSILSSDNAAPTNVNTAQNVFSSGQSTVTVQASETYEFEAGYEIDTTGATSNSLATLFAGTATFTSLAYDAIVTNGTASNTPSAPTITRATVATATSITALAVASATQRTIKLRGTFRVNAAGTIIPQFQYSAAPGAAPVVKANSFFRVWPVGSNTVTSIGDWS